MRKIDGCLDAFFLKVIESQKPQYLWVVLWKSQVAFDAARSSPAWREQIKKFEEGKFYKTLPLQLVCETLGSFSPQATVKATKTRKREKPKTARKPGPAEQAVEQAETEAGEPEESPITQVGPTAEGE